MATLLNVQENMTGVITSRVVLLLVALTVTACGSEKNVETAGTPESTPRSTAEAGSCHGQVAQQEARGVAIVEWIPLGLGLPTEVDAVFVASGIEDLGERDIYAGEDGVGVDMPRLARFVGTATLVGDGDEPVEALVSPYQLADAVAEIDSSARLLVWFSPQGEDPPVASFASLVALEPDGDVVFLGDCVPGWTAAFAAYVEAEGRGLTGAELLTRILVDPEGPEALAFRASDAAQTLAGPTRN